MCLISWHGLGGSRLWISFAAHVIVLAKVSANPIAGKFFVITLFACGSFDLQKT
jgi:hypothetical protein